MKDIKLRKLMCYLLYFIIFIGVILSVFTMLHTQIVISDNLYGKIIISTIPALFSVALTFIVTNHFNKISSEFQKKLVLRSETHTQKVEKRNFYYKIFGLRYYINNQQIKDNSIFLIEINKIPAVFAENEKVLDAYKKVVTDAQSMTAAQKTILIIELYQEMFKVVEPDKEFDRNTMEKYIYLSN